MIAACQSLDDLAIAAATLWRQRTRSQLQFEMDQQTRRACLTGRRQFLAMLRETVRERRFEHALGFFGNESDAGFLWLERAFPLMLDSERAACLSHAWTMGLFGEHAILCGRRRMNPSTAHARALQLFKSTPMLRPKDLPIGVVRIYRGVRESDETKLCRHQRAIAWTLRRDVAAWFALRGADNRLDHAWILSADIDGAKVLAVLDDRDEAEAIVDPAQISGIVIERPSARDVESADALIRE